MKKVLSIILAVVMVLGSMSFVMADDGIKITINGEAKKFDVMPQIIEGRTLVPMRAIFEALGAEVGWDDATKTATGKTASTTVALTIDNKEAKVNGKAVALDVPAQIIESRTMVPARFVAESLGCKVDWDGNTKTVIITMESKKEEQKPAGDGWTDMVKIGFEGNSVAPSTGINFWGRDAANKNLDGSFKYVTYSSGSVPKPNTTEDFGDTLLKVDTSIKPGSTVGISEGRINDIPADKAVFAQGGKYKLSFWVCLAETTNGGNSAKLTPKVYCGKEVDGFKSAVKTFTLTKGKWTKIELNLTGEAKHVGATTGVRFSFDKVDGNYASVVYIDNVVFSKPSDASDAPVVSEKKEESTPTVITPAEGNAQPTAGTSLVKIGFEGNNVAPSTGINFWGKDAANKNLDGSFKYVTYSSGSVPKPNTTEDFGDTLLKVDTSIKPGSTLGISEGRINDIPADKVAFKEGGKYKLSFWVCLAETTNGGNSAKLTPKVYCGKEVDGFKSAVKTFTLTKGKWTKIELDLTGEAKHDGATTGVRFSFAKVDGNYASVVYIDNIEFTKVG